VVPDHDDWARPYRKAGRGHAPEVIAGDGALAALGGIWSSVDDVTRWSRWLADAHPARDEPDGGPLRRATRREMQQLHRYHENEKLAGRLAPTGYGYGLVRREDATLGPLVGHSGGLPGYGSNMRWAPGRGVVVVALANVTYAPMAELTLRMFDELQRAGVVPPVAVPLDPDVERLARALVDLLHDWDDDRADNLFTDNVALDDPYDRRRSKALELIGAGGPATITGITAVSAAAADVLMEDATGGALKLELELAPLVPARIESYTLSRSRPARK
jgi:CubicO group peptidase (beta-lactamase class C family)